MASNQSRSSAGRRAASSSGAKSSSKSKSTSRSSGSGRTSSAKSSGRQNSSRSRQTPPPKPIRREVGSAVCLFLAIFAALGYFGLEGLFIDHLSNLIKGLIGYGYWVMPPMLLLGAYILAFHHGRPVRLRLFCALALPTLLGGLLHLFLAKGDYAWSGALLGQLWRDGLALRAGGVIGGLLSLGCKAIFSSVGAGILFVLLLALMLLGAFNRSVSELVDQFKARPRRERREYTPEPAREDEEEIPDFSAASGKTRPHEMPITRTASNTALSDFDIPFDEEEIPRMEVEIKHEAKKKTGFFDRNRAVPTPHEFLSGAASKPLSEAQKDHLTGMEEVPFDPDTPPFDVDIPAPEAARSRPDAGQEPVSDVFASDLTPEIPDFAPVDPIFARESAPPAPTKPVTAPASSPAAATAPNEGANAKVTAKEAALAASEVTAEIASSLEAATPIAYQYPPVSLLTEGGGVTGEQALGELKLNQDRLTATIQSFGVNANIVNVVRGPSVTRYEMELDQGVKLSRITNLSDDIALALGAEAVRIAPIPDKISTVGIEVPNKLVSTVHIHDVIDTPAFTDHSSKVAFAVGKDIGGNPIVGNIAKLPHLLIAGTTGSGKSVCTNSLIISLLYKATPEEVRLIMVDPKMVELGIYNGIPHLLIPVVTDPKKAAGALQWAVTEMMKRYRAFSEMGVRDLASYNARVAKTGEGTKMPQVVVLIDELADLMLVAAKEVEESICRVAQMGRASGMHLVIATQRPSADVITGLMKANIPSRIAFAVASSLESRIILDQTGAEKLVGKGDMLFAPLGEGKPLRVQGCFVSDDEVAAVVDFVKQTGTADYDQSVLEEIEHHAAEKDKAANKGSASAAEERGDGEDFDEMLIPAIEVVVEMGQASVSMLQRRLKLGYGRAARIVDQMEEKGIVGPYEGSKPRQVLVTKAQWQEMQYRQGLNDGALPDMTAQPRPDDAPFDGGTEAETFDAPVGFDDAPEFDTEFDDAPPFDEDEF